MKIAVSNDNDLPYRDSAPIQGKLTVLNAILGRLLHADNNYDLSVKGGHLKSFKWDYEKQAYLLKLKDGLLFHNGRKVTSKDLEFSILRGFFSKNRHWFEAFFSNIKGINEAKGKAYQSGLVEGVKIISNDTIQIQLKKPNPSFLHSIAITYFSLVPIEELRKDYVTWKKYPVGAGKFKVIKINKNSSVELEETNNNKNKIIFTVNGQEIDSDIALTGFAKDSIFKNAYSEKATSVTGIFFNYNNTIASDLNFRKAIDLVLDRKKIIGDLVMYKETKQFLASHFWGRIKSVESRNIKNAKAYLSKVKKLDSKSIYKIPVFNSFYGDKKLGKYLTHLEDQLKEIGVNVSFYETKNKFLDKNDKTTIFKIFSLGADVMEPLILFGLMRGSSPFYPHFPTDSTYDDIFNRALSEKTQEEKIAMTKKLSRYFYTNKISIPLFERKLIYNYNPKTIKSLGTQDAGLTFLTNNVEAQ